MNINKMTDKETCNSVCDRESNTNTNQRGNVKQRYSFVTLPQIQSIRRTYWKTLAHLIRTGCPWVGIAQ